MSLSKIKEISSKTLRDIEQEVLEIKKDLFKLRISRVIKKDFKPHYFKHKKHKLAQLLMIRQSLISKKSKGRYCYFYG
uniref:Ribosomal protein L29 n=1 Tax=Phaeophyceae sp. TaxID=2249243 RepID=A0A8E5BGW4_9PHAE|nr:ribosomal protein L29 [Phaeophyceae sp.]